MSSNSTRRDLTASRDTEVGWQLPPPSIGKKLHYKVQRQLEKATLQIVKDSQKRET
jgi:hypothetical protein